MTATIIAVSSTKGGPGKTTLSGNLADYWTIGGLNVAMIDTDPNQTLTQWHRTADGPFKDIPLVSEPIEDKIVPVISALMDGHDILVLDVAGFGSKALLYAASMANLVLIPSRPSPGDVAEAIKTNQIVDNASKMTRRHIPRVAVLSAVKPNAAVALHSLRQLRNAGLHVCMRTVSDRTMFQKAQYAGTTVVRAEPGGGAAQDISFLGDELLDYLRAQAAA
jgi:chromosome partitioning protein